MNIINSLRASRAGQKWAGTKVGRNFSELADKLALYWGHYGGLPDFVSSPFTLVSLALTAMLSPLWWGGGWWEDVQTIVPSLLGFSLGGFAMYLAFTHERFLDLTTIKNQEKPPEAPTPYVCFANTFMHFIMVQLGALALALVAESFSKLGVWPGEAMAQLNFVAQKAFWFLGFFLFILSLATALAATLGIYDIVHLLDDIHRNDRENRAS